MLVSKIMGRACFCANKNVNIKAPKAPKLLNAELEYFKYDLGLSDHLGNLNRDKLYHRLKKTHLVFYFYSNDLT